MNVNSIRATLLQCKTSTINVLNEIGGATRNGASQAIQFAKDKKDVFENSNLGKKAKENGVTKDTLIGLGVSAATVILAAKCIIGIKNKIDELKNK